MEGSPEVLVGQCVDFVDPHGKAHEALVTSVFHGPSWPSVNVVLVSDDETKTDQYGRQVERFTSVVHQSNQSAHGMYWREVG